MSIFPCSILPWQLEIKAISFPILPLVESSNILSTNILRVQIHFKHIQTRKISRCKSINVNTLRHCSVIPNQYMGCMHFEVVTSPAATETGKCDAVTWHETLDLHTILPSSFNDWLHYSAVRCGQNMRFLFIREFFSIRWIASIRVWILHKVYSNWQ